MPAMPSHTPPRLPCTMASSSPLCSGEVDSSRYTSARSIPPKKSPGSSAWRANRVSPRSTPFDAPESTANARRPEHHSCVGFAGPRLQGQNSSQLHDSYQVPLRVPAMALPFASGS